MVEKGRGTCKFEKMRAKRRKVVERANMRTLRSASLAFLSVGMM
jgi:hypothetical protein